PTSSALPPQITGRRCPMQHLKLIRLKEEQESDMRDFLDLMERFKKGLEELGALHSQQFPPSK
ncbi:hypothetical protein, partial [Xylella fastidiosa]|uniref:hypothetical protein n=1 Tax=Xylella fastidiosa TaxID=2371 RepID=UPI001EEB8B08